MRIIAIGGFLGSGKTSILLQLVSYLNSLKTNPDTEKPHVVILENEIGEAGIDDKLIKSQGYIVETMVSGCICCQMIGEMIHCVNQIKKRIAPEWLVIEATGMANLTTVVRTLERRAEGVTNISGLIVIDADRYETIVEKMPGMIRGQIANADAILLNKVDLVNEHQLKELEQKIKDIGKNALFFSISAREMIDTHLWKEVVSQNEKLKFTA